MLNEDDRMADKILVVGATSAIAQSISRRLAKAHPRLFLVGRDERRLRIVADDLVVRGAATVGYRAVDFRHPELFERVVTDAIDQMGGLSVMLVVHGTLTDQTRAQVDVPYLVDEISVNLVSALSFLVLAANWFEKQRSGKIVVFGSVAGDRGRQSNYVYGAAKSGLATFVQGLRNRLAPRGVQVLLVKPGFVDTPMTAGLPKNFLYAAPDKIGDDVVRAMSRNKSVLYTPWFWRYIMAAVRAIPERIFVRLRL